MSLRNLLPVILLVVGLVAGFVGGAVMRPVTVTEVSTTTETTTSTYASTVRETMVQTTTTTSIQTVLRTFTQTLTQTFRTTDTVTRTTTQTALTTVYPAERGSVLVTDRGSGDKDTRPFTLETVSDLKITIRIIARADLRFVGLTWYLYNVDIDRWIRHGEVDEDQGVFEFYAARVPAGNWYVRIISANCNWEITVENVT